MKIAICDNDPLFAEEFKKQLTDAFKLYNSYIYNFTNIQAVLDENAGGADIVFMDLEWCGSVDGIDIAEYLYQHNMAAKIVYVTGHIDRFVQQIYLKQTNVAGILTKPVDQHLLEQLLHKILSDQRSSHRDDFVIHQNGQAIRLSEDKVLYMESKNHVVEIAAANQIYRLYQPLNSLLPLLPDCFVRCHRSYVVNMNKIQSIEHQELILTEGTRIPIGRMYNNAVKQSFVDWVSRGI